MMLVALQASAPTTRSDCFVVGSAVVSTVDRRYAALSLGGKGYPTPAARITACGRSNVLLVRSGRSGWTVVMAASKWRCNDRYAPRRVIEDLFGTCTAGSAHAFTAAVIRPTVYTRAITQICAHALLFEETHAIGTRAGALELAEDIRASARRRYARVAALRAPQSDQPPIGRWLSLERKLTEAYALNYVRIYDLIAEPRTTPEQRTRAARRLAELMRAPDPLRRAAARLERQLHIPDCSGA
jgi:hypothetical protein